MTYPESISKHFNSLSYKSNWASWLNPFANRIDAVYIVANQPGKSKLRGLSIQSAHDADTSCCRSAISSFLMHWPPH